MTSTTRSAIKAIKLYKHVVQSVEKFIQKVRVCQYLTLHNIQIVVLLTNTLTTATIKIFHLYFNLQVTFI